MSRDSDTENGFIQTVLALDNPRARCQRFVCTMPGCSNAFEVRMSGERRPVAVVLNLAKRKGWAIKGDGKKIRICPNHQKPKTEPETKPMATQTTPSPDALEQRRKVFYLIDENYAQGRYQNRMTDAKIASKLGVPTSVVSTVREGNFGPAGPDPELAEIETKLEALKVRVEGLDNSLIAALEKTSDASARISEEIKQLGAALSRLNGGAK